MPNADADRPRGPESEEGIAEAVERCRAIMIDLTLDEKTEAVRRPNGWLGLKEFTWTGAARTARTRGIRDALTKLVRDEEAAIKKLTSKQAG
jgi:hypothetical protein